MAGSTDGRRRPRRAAAVAPARGILPGLVGYALRRAQVAVFQDFARAFAELGAPLSPGEFGILALVAANRGMSQTALARAVGVDRSTLVPILDRLEARGLVRRRRSAEDRRTHALELGLEGGRMMPSFEAAVRRHERRIQRGLSAAEGCRLIELLDRLRQGAEAG